jgi:metal binding Ada-like protein
VFELIGPAGKAHPSTAAGTLGRHRRSRISGRLDCPSALWAIAGGDVRQRVFFADEETAVAAGHRPCARCVPETHRPGREGGA